MKNYAGKILLSQSETFALRDQLLLKSRSLSAALESATGKIIAEPTLGRRSDTVFADISTLETHCEALQSEINAACKGTQQPSTLTPAPTTPPSTLASTTATGAEKKNAWNPDADILKARGVTSLAELNKLPPADAGD